MRLTRSLCNIFLAGLVLLQAPPHTAHIRGGSVKRQQVILPTKNFDQSTMLAEFHRILSSRNDDEGIFLLEAFDNERSENLSAMGVNDATYTFWQTLYSDYKTVIPPFAELLVIGHNAAMRLRDNSYHVSLAVLEGQNPYDVRACGRSFDLAHLAVKEQTSGRMSPTSSPELHFFLTTNGTIDEPITRCARDVLQRLAPKVVVSVSIRNDPWFLLDPDYPVVLPFVTENNPPTEEEYERAAYWECELYEQRVLCSGGPRSPAAPSSQRH